MNGVFRTGSHARRLGALLAGYREMEIAGIATAAQHLNAGPGAPFFPCMLIGASRLAFPATCTLERVDRKKPVSDHLDDLLSILD
jgi:hypothetical protein